MVGANNVDGNVDARRTLARLGADRVGVAIARPLDPSRSRARGWVADRDRARRFTTGGGRRDLGDVDLPPVTLQLLSVVGEHS